MEVKSSVTLANTELLTRLERLDVRIPRWNESDLANRPCPFCGVPGRPELLRPDGLIVNLCVGCGAYYVSPAPTEAALKRFYGTYSHTHSVHELGTPEKAKAFRQSPPVGDIRIQALLSLVNIRGLRVLDVGCGQGETLYQLKQLGAQPYGLDLDEKAVAYARNELGLNGVNLGTLADHFEGDSFDVVIMNDFLEHPLDPLATLERARSFMSKGALLSIWTPNAATYSGSGDSTLFRVDLEHLQFASPALCNRIATRLGMDIVHLETIGFPGIHQVVQHPRRRRMVAKAKGYARRLPGGRLAGIFRQSMSAMNAPDPRSGNYHLFCIFRAL